MPPCQTPPKPMSPLHWVTYLYCHPTPSPSLTLPQYPRQKLWNTQHSNGCLLACLHVTSQRKKYLPCHPKGRIFFCVQIILVSNTEYKKKRSKNEGNQRDNTEVSHWPFIAWQCNIMLCSQIIMWLYTRGPSNGPQNSSMAPSQCPRGIIWVWLYQI